MRRGIAPTKVPARPVAFCGIARPQSFMLQLRKAGIEPAAEAVYRDHHAYTEKDIRELIALKASERGRWLRYDREGRHQPWRIFLRA